MKLMMAPVVELSSPRSDSPETLLREWVLFTRRSKALHEAARLHYTRMSDCGLVTAVVMGSAVGLINISLGTGSSSGADLNISQVALGYISIVSAAIISAAKQLQWEAKALLYARPRCAMAS